MPQEDGFRTRSVGELSVSALDATEAVAVVAAVTGHCVRHAFAGAAFELPIDSDILVDESGSVRFADLVPSERPVELVPALAHLLRRLLNLDSVARPSSVPGAVMVLMARALGEIDLPRPTLSEFHAALLRVTPQPAAILARLVATEPGATESTTTPLPARPGLFTPLRGYWRPALAFSAGAVMTLALMSVHDPFNAIHRTAPPVTRQHGRSAPAVAAPAVVARPSRQTSAPVTRAAAHLVLGDIGGHDTFSPSFSADGHAMYFHAGRTNGRLMRADLTDTGRIADVQPLLADDASNYHVVASPDGSRLAFDSDRDGVRGVYVANGDLTAVTRISGAGFAAVPSWSPDGSRLAFVKAGATPRVWNVWIADTRTGVLQQISDHRVGQSWGASWFPDGQRLAYSVEDQLVVVDLATGRQTTIRSPRRGRLVRTPSVSPDGSRVVFQVLGDGVWMLDVPRGRISRILADGTAEEFHWSPDGRRFAYHARTGRGWGVWTFGAAS